MKNLNYRKPAEIREEIREYLKTNFVLLDDPKLQELIKEQKESEKLQKDHEMYLYIEGQNLVNDRLKKLIPIYYDRINSVLNEKFYNMDNSRTKKYLDLFKDLEGTETKETKKYKYRLTTQTRQSHNCFYLDVSIHIWTEKAKHNIENSKYLATLENQTSFKEVNQHNNENDFKNYSLKAEIKKTTEYQAQKAKLNALKSQLNTNFSKVFILSFENDRF
jgi:hypothetical protein